MLDAAMSKAFCEKDIRTRRSSMLSMSEKYEIDRKEKKKESSSPFEKRFMILPRGC
jgi:hypothetical protein